MRRSIFLHRSKYYHVVHDLIPRGAAMPTISVIWKRFSEFWWSCD